MAHRVETSITHEIVIEYIPDDEDGKPWNPCFQLFQIIESQLEDPTKMELYSPPNFLHPFDDPEIFRKLENDYRTQELVDDPYFKSLIKTLKESPVIFDKEFRNIMHHCQLRMALRVLLFGKEGYFTDAERSPPPPGKGILPPDIVTGWMQILSSVEEPQFNKSLEVRQIGKDAFKAGDYEAALQHYEQAIRIFPYEMTGFLRIGYVHFETKKFEKCIAICLEAVKVGEMNSTHPRYIAKALLQIGKAYKELEDYENAKKYVEKALAQSSTPEGASLLSEIERFLKKRTNGSIELQAEGKEKFEKGHYAAAAELFTKTIELDSEDAKLYKNRAACYIKKRDFELALNDCEKCLELDPDDSGVWLMKARCMQKLALSAYDKVLQLDDSNLEALKEYGVCASAVSKAFKTLAIE